MFSSASPQCAYSRSFTSEAGEAARPPRCSWRATPGQAGSSSACPVPTPTPPDQRLGRRQVALLVSLDGRHIAFVSNRDGSGEIYVMELREAAVERLSVTTIASQTGSIAVRRRAFENAGGKGPPHLPEEFRQALDNLALVEDL